MGQKKPTARAHDRSILICRILRAFSNLLAIRKCAIGPSEMYAKRSARYAG
jgi:hypothetical protein